MKHLLLLCLLYALGAHAQSAPANPAPAAAPYHYCALLVDDRFFAVPGHIQLDYGQSAPGAVVDAEMAEMAKNIQASRNVIDVLNYLSRHGWELLTTTTVQSEENRGSSSSSFVNETRYLFRRRTP